MPSHMSGAKDLVLGRQNEVMRELFFKKFLENFKN
jgi:hypothetical protein